MAEKEIKPEKKGKGTAVTRVVIAIAAVVAAAGIFTAACTAMLPKDTIINGVKTEGIDVSGMTLGEAIDAIEDNDVYNNISFTVSESGQSKTIHATEVDLAVDVNATAQKVFDVCKTKNKLADAFKSVKLKFKPEEITAVPTVNTEKLDAILLEFGKQINGEKTENTVEIAEDKAIITPGIAGQSTDVSETREAVMKAIENGETDIDIDLKTEKPTQFDADSLIAAVHRDAENAAYILENGAAVVKPHVVGAQADASQAKAAAEKVNSGEVAEISITRSMPEITTESLQSKLYTGTLASYSTKYSTSAVNRSKNVELATSRINGTVLLPGDVFSYNGVVGTRTVSNGFKNAPVYENGKSVDGIGGGVCQVSTTLYSAVLYADLEVVQRQNHSLTVGYVPLGQDATVVDGAIDFQFKNNTDTPVRIDAYASRGTISISLVGTPVSGKSVKVTHSTVSTKQPTEKEINDPTLPAGTRQITTQGKAGYTIRSTKIVYKDGKEISRQSLGNSTYKMVQTEVSVGTGEAVPTAAPEAVQPVTAPVEAVTPTEAPAQEPTSAPVEAPVEISGEITRPAPNPEAAE